MGDEVMKFPIAIAVIALSLAFFGCADPYMTSAGQSVTDENGNTLNLTVMPDNIDISSTGSVAVMVQTYDADGQPIVGAEITLSATLGTMTDSSVTTDDSGTAATTMTPGKVPGWGVVVAIYQSNMAEAPISCYDGSSGTNATF